MNDCDEISLKMMTRLRKALTVTSTVKDSQIKEVSDVMEGENLLLAYLKGCSIPTPLRELTKD